MLKVCVGRVGGTETGRFGLLYGREGGTDTEGGGAREVDGAPIATLVGVSADRSVAVSSSDQVEYWLDRRVS